MKRSDVEVLRRIVEWAEAHPDLPLEISGGPGKYVGDFEVRVLFYEKMYDWEDLSKAVKSDSFPELGLGQDDE